MIEHSTVLALSRTLRAGAASRHPGQRLRAVLCRVTGRDGGMSVLVEQRDCVGSCGDGLAEIGIEQCLPLQEDAGEGEQPVGDAANGTAMGVAALAQSTIAAAALGVVLDGDARPMIDGITQPNVRGIAPDDNVGLATPPGDRGDARQGPERLVIAASERPGRLGEQRGEIDPADPREDLRLSTSRRSPLCSAVADRSLNAAHSSSSLRAAS